MKSKMTMRAALDDPRLFGKILKTPSFFAKLFHFRGDTWAGWRVLLIAMMGEALTPSQRVIFTALTGRPYEPGKYKPGRPVKEFWEISETPWWQVSGNGSSCNVSCDHG